MFHSTYYPISTNIYSTYFLAEILWTLADMSGGKRRAPPKAEKLVDFHSNIVKEVSAKYPGHPLILAGKSMGSRCYSLLVFRIPLYNLELSPVLFGIS